MGEHATQCVGEFLGTLILILLGNSVVANVSLSRTKGHGSGWLVITTGWGLAVYSAVLCVEEISGAHLNPAVTIGLAMAGKFPWTSTAGFIASQMLGGIAGGGLVYLFYKPHYALTEDADAKLGTFCNAPAVRTLPLNFFCEVVATFVLVYAVLVMSSPSIDLADTKNTLQPVSATADPKTSNTVEKPAKTTTASSVKVGLGSLGAIRVALIVFAVGISLGGTTGYAINPARDLGPRIAHALLPIPGKRDSDWSYAAIPVIGPIVGGMIAATLYWWLPGL